MSSNESEQFRQQPIVINVSCGDNGQGITLSDIADLITQLGVAMTQQIDALKTAVQNESTVIDSAVTLLNGLSAQIRALKDDPAALQALADEVTAKSAALSAAVAANTPAA